ncbi:hypothetical protein SLS63_001488 [Diaporthe eres]|uniref:DUF7908 domain-containing protein n=1 Tax=Diaporthe eres TaxID=83184 RepID=A0ABR1PMD3_DIAER
MKGNLIYGFFSTLVGVALVSGHHLEETPPYGYPLPGGVVTTITSIVQVPTLVPTLVPIFPTPLLTTPLSVLPSPSLATPPSTSGPGPAPSPFPGPVEIILAIVPAVSGRMLEKRTAAKRDLGGFISDDAGSPNPKDCRSATVYRLDSGRLQISSRLTFSIFADAGTSFTEFRARESLNVGANIVATTFLNDNSILRWRNASFSGGEAGFCQVPATGQVQLMRGWQYHYHSKPATKHHFDRKFCRFHPECWAVFELAFDVRFPAFFRRFHPEYWAIFGPAYDAFVLSVRNKFDFSVNIRDSDFFHGINSNTLYVPVNGQHSQYGLHADDSIVGEQ